MAVAKKAAKKPPMMIVDDTGDVAQVTEILARDIEAVAKAARSLTGSRLREDALILLLSHSSKLSQKAVKQVLDAMKDLDRKYLK